MRISEEQNCILNGLICQRLSADKSNENLMKFFTNVRGSSLVSYFKKFGLEEDTDGRTSYYVIKTPENEILMFFSVKCGVLFEPLQDENEIVEDMQRLMILIQAIENANKNNGIADEANAILAKYQVGDRISIDDFEKIIAKKYRNSKYFIESLSKDKKIEGNNNILRVQNTHPAIELVHFCTNEKLRNKWKTYNLGHPMGETLYWKFIVPIFIKVQEIVGCEYAFLFAADLSEDGTLVNYYDVSLKFQKKQDIGTNKPLYDFCCEFMCQKINDMKSMRKSFFDNFNIDQDDLLI
jgi:hypothetical protein